MKTFGKNSVFEESDQKYTLHGMEIHGGTLTGSLQEGANGDKW